MIGRARRCRGLRRPCGAWRRHDVHGADPRRERHGQGAGRARAPRASGRAADGPLRRRQLRRAARAACSRASSSATSGAPSPAPIERRTARFEPADGGTLFLDEIGEMALGAAGEAAARARASASSAASAATRKIAVDVRVRRGDATATSSRPSRRAASARISSTASRSCRSSCRRCGSAATTSPLLAEHFLARRAHAAGQPRASGSTPEALAALERYAWPGNVRELRNCMESLTLH